jgi:hypothetical protein
LPKGPPNCEKAEPYSLLRGELRTSVVDRVLRIVPPEGLLETLSSRRAGITSKAPVATTASNRGSNSSTRRRPNRDVPASIVVLL